MFTSISIIAVGAFILTLGVVIYEVILLKKKKPVQSADKTVQLPDYAQDPQAVQNMSTIPTALPTNGQVVEEAQAPFQPRTLPSTKVIIAFIIGGVLLVGALVAGAMGINKSNEDKKVIWQAQGSQASKRAQPSQFPTVYLSPTPTRSQPYVTIAIETDTQNSTPSGDIEKDLSQSPSPTKSSSNSMPTAGVIQQTLILAGVSLFFIVLAFIL